MNNRIQMAVREFTSRHPQVLAVFIFGSYAKDRARESSDVDLAVYVDPKFVSNEGGMELTLKYTVELENAVKKRVDVVLLNQAPPILRHQVFRNGVLIFERDHARVRRFIGDALVEFYDEIYLLEAAQKATIRRHLLGR